jgi:hypothetical protein
VSLARLLAPDLRQVPRRSRRAGTAIWRAVLPRPDWGPQEPGSYCIFGVPPAMVLSFPLHGENVGWQVARRIETRRVLPNLAWTPSSCCGCSLMPACTPPPLPRLPCQAFIPWPAERLEEIGGTRAMYTQDALSRREQGQARKLRALGALEGWCSRVRGPTGAAGHPPTSSSC